MRKYLILLAFMAVILTACRVESNVVLDINDDGSATVGAEIGFDEEFEQLISESGGSPDDLFGDVPAFGDEVVVVERVEGDMTYYGAFTEVDDLSTVSAGSSELEGFSSFSYTHDDSSATLTATIDASDPGEFGDMGDLGLDPSAITDEFFSASLAVTMPGTVTEHNADEVRSDGTLVWEIPLVGSTDVFATSEVGASTASWLIFIIALVLVVGVIAAVVATIVSRKESQKTVEAAAAAHATDAEAPDADSAESDSADDAEAAIAAADEDPTVSGADEGESADESSGTDDAHGSETDDSATDGGEGEEDSV